MNVFARQLMGAFKDLAPILVVVAFFQFVVLRQPIEEPLSILAGLIAVIVGLALFIQGLETSLFPLGESMAGAFARKGVIAWLLLFAFALGFGTAVAEPALIAVAQEAARIKAEAGHLTGEAAVDAYALGLRYTVAVSVGLALMVGVVRILAGWPIHYFIISGYLIIILITRFAPDDIIGIAYDSGGVTTSTITVPLVTALGIGLSTVIQGRNPMVDGFGLIALACLFPIAFILVYGMVV